MKIFWFSLLLLENYVNCQEERSSDVLVDPNDPTCNYCSAQSKNLVSIPSPVDQSLRLILRQFLQNINVDYQLEVAVGREVQIQISRYNMGVLSKYLKDNSLNSQKDREAVRSALSDIFKVTGTAPEPTWLDTFMILQPFIYTLNLFALAVTTVVAIRTIVSRRNFWFLFIVTLILISWFSGCNRKFQEAEAKRLALYNEISKEDACAPEGFFSRMIGKLTSWIQYKQKSKCLEYIESQTISVINEISVIEVFSETVSGGFFAFFSTSAKHINQFFRNLYAGTPLLAQIVITFFLFATFGAIRTPFFTYESNFLPLCSSSLGMITNLLVEQDTREQPMVRVKSPKNNAESLEQAENNKPAMIENPKSEEGESTMSKIKSKIGEIPKIISQIVGKDKNHEIAKTPKKREEERELTKKADGSSNSSLGAGPTRRVSSPGESSEDKDHEIAETSEKSEGEREVTKKADDSANSSERAGPAPKVSSPGESSEDKDHETAETSEKSEVEREVTKKADDSSDSPEGEDLTRKVNLLGESSKDKDHEIAKTPKKSEEEIELTKKADDSANSSERAGPAPKVSSPGESSEDKDHEIAKTPTRL